MGNTQHPKRPLSTGYRKRPPYYQNQENVNDEYLIPSKHNNTNDVIIKTKGTNIIIYRSVNIKETLTVIIMFVYKASESYHKFS